MKKALLLMTLLLTSSIIFNANAQTDSQINLKYYERRNENRRENIY